MKIEKYTGRDTRDAMARVRAEFGPDAYILANRRVGGRVELTVARDIESVLEPSGPAAKGPSPAGDGQMKALEQELMRLRGILESELGERSWRDVAHRKPTLTTLRQRLLRLGLSRSLAGQLMQGLPPAAGLEQAWRAALGGLSRRIDVLALPQDGDAVIALYGGTGVGKTSTVAKLAGLDIQRRGRDSVGLVSLDEYRIGAREQLAAFADSVGIPLRMASDRDSLRRALREYAGRRVYIDTAGMSQRDPRLREQLALVRGAVPYAAHVLVMAASTHAAQNRALLAALGSDAFCGAIITKVDEVQTLGGSIDVLVQGGLPLTGTTDGQRVPEDFQPGDAAQLVSRALELAPPGSAAVPPAHRPGRPRAGVAIN